MFQPQPTPFASNCFGPYGFGTDLSYSFVPAGGGGAGSLSHSQPAPVLYTTQPPLLAVHHRHHLPPQSQQQPQQHPPQQLSQLPQQQQQQQPRRQPSASSDSSSTFLPATVIPVSQPQQLSLSSSPQLQLQLPQFQQQHQQHQQPPPPPQYSRVIPKMEDQDEHDMAAQQAAAREYRPVHEGPAVGDKTPSEAITREYANADPAYVEKTLTLPQTYSQYRSIRGDGNCGWRAIGFAYFEKLVETGDRSIIQGEMVRLRSLCPLIKRVGGYDFWEDFFEEVMELMRLIASHMDNPDLALMVLVEQWNDANVTNSVIYFMRLLAATYLKDNASTYEPFLLDHVDGVQGYCQRHVEALDKEIEHLGVVALVEYLVKPAGLVLEIAYLDRSPGTQVNTYRFPEEANGQDPANLGPIIYLLYRPGHYDILYRTPPPPPPPPPPGPITMQVNRVDSFSHNTDFNLTQSSLGAFSNMDYNMLSMIPGLSGPMGGMASLAPPPPPVVSSAPEPFSPVQQDWMPQFPDIIPSSTPQPPQQQPAVVAPPQPPSPPMPLPPTSAKEVRGGRSAGRRAPTVLPPPRSRSGSSSWHIRFSPVQLEYQVKTSRPESTFVVTTNTFKNSVWNRAHYGNPDFHPEEWTPDDEHTDGRVGGRRKVKKEPST